MESKDLEAQALRSKMAQKTDQGCFADSILPSLTKDEGTDERKCSDADIQIGEILEGFLLGYADIKESFACDLETNQALYAPDGMKSDAEVEKTMQRTRLRQNITVVIPSTDQLSSSPGITFGQTTLSMVDEFMANESPHRRKVGKIRKSKRSLLGWLFFCC